MYLANVDYKKISFTRSGEIDVDVIVNLNDPNNLDENFLVLELSKVDNLIEFELFYWMDKKRWTLNEFVFFALNNSLCMRISDSDGNELTSYGICDDNLRIFSNTFGINFN